MENEIEVLKVKKYKFVRKGVDNWVLQYKDKEIECNSKVNFIKELQDVPRKARVNMVMDLAKKGMTVKDLIVEHTEGSKTIQDHSNKDFIEKGYVEQAQAEVFDNIVKEMFGMDYTTLVLDIGLETEEETIEFGKELGDVLKGTIPRGN